MGRTDWVAWRTVYDDPTSEASRRLQSLQARLREVLDRQPPGPIRVVIPCAGQGRDLLGVLVDHPRRDDVAATLIDIDPGNVEIARAAIEELMLPGVTAIVGDAGRTTTYVGAVPASVVVLAGFFTYLSDRHAARLITMLPQLCAEDAVVVWSRRPNVQKRTIPRTRERFDSAGFREIASDVANAPDVHVGVERFVGTPVALDANARLFRFRDLRRLTNRTFGRLRRSLRHRTGRRQ